MKTSISLGAVAALATLGFTVQAQEISGRVISSTPVLQQVQVPRQVCSNQPMAVQQPKTGAGVALGAIAGGALGNAIGGGSGRAAATILGVIGGAVVGDRIEGGGVSGYQNVQQCSTEVFYENRTVAYNVTYEHGGRQHSVQMPSDPGPSIRLQVSPMGAVASQDSYPVAGGYGGGTSAPAWVQSVPAVVASSNVVHSATYYPGAYPSPYYTSSYYAPAYYPSYAPAFYPPVGLSIGFGFGGGWGGHRGHHGHRGHPGHRGHHGHGH